MSNVTAAPPRGRGRGCFDALIVEALLVMDDAFIADLRRLHANA
jgi:hypothetical protein